MIFSDSMEILVGVLQIVPKVTGTSRKHGQQQNSSSLQFLLHMEFQVTGYQSKWLFKNKYVQLYLEVILIL